MSAPESVTYREVQELLRTFAGSGWSGMTLRVGDMTITVGKDGPPGTPAPAAPPAAAPPAAAPATAASVSAAPSTSSQGGGGSAAPGTLDTTGLVAVRSPAIGAFWVSPAPGQPPFVQVGQVVAVDEQLAIVEVMKLMNPVVTAQAGEVVAVCAANAELVEYDQVLFWLRPSDG